MPSSLLDQSLSVIVRRLRRQKSDDGLYEAKSCGGGLSRSVWSSVSAFANTHGGFLLLGLDEHAGFTIAKGFDLDKVRSQFLDGIGDGGVGGVRLTNPPRYDEEREDFEGGQILVVRIYENDPEQKPCFVTAQGVVSGSYKRIDDKDVRLSPTEIYELKNILRPGTADMHIVPEATQDDLDPRIVSQIIANRTGSRAFYEARTQTEKMIRLNLVDRKGGVRMAGVLVAGKYPQQFFPRLFVDVAVHPGTGKGSDGSLRFIDRESCEGSMAQMVSDAVEATARNLRTFSFVEGVGRTDELEIPREVLREAIANAVVHREYSPDFCGQPVSVDIYTDRVEVLSPGGLWGGKTLENIADGTSKCRNGLLMQLMRAAAPAGEQIVEGQGTGISFMMNEMKERALHKPEFQAKPDEFRVILRRLGAEYPQIHAWVRKRAGQDLPRTEESVLLALRRARKPLSVEDLHADLGYDSDTVRQYLRDLREKNVVDRTSDGRFAVSGLSEDVRASRVSTFSDRRHETRKNHSFDKHQGAYRGKKSVTNSRTKVLEAIPHGIFVSREIAKATGLSLVTVRRILHTLVAEGVIRSIGKPTSRNRRYELLHG